MPEALKIKPETLNVEDEINGLRSKVVDLNTKNESLESQVGDLKTQLKMFSRIIFGSKSEKSPPPVAENQLKLFSTSTDIDPGVESDGLPSGPEDKEIILDGDKPKEEAKKPRKRRKPPIELETKEITLDPTPEDLIDEHGEKLTVIGYEKSERLDYVPSKIVRVIIKRAIIGSFDSRDYHSTTLYPSIVNKGKLTDSFIHELVYDKFVMGLPLYRQLKEFNRRGASLSSSILSDSIKRFAAFYNPIYDAIRLESVSGEFVHADESPMKMAENYIDKETNKTSKKYRQAYFWVLRNRDACYFHFGPSRSHKEISTIMDFGDNDKKNHPDTPGYEKKACFGYMMVDGYAVYPCAKEKNIITAKLMACWAHARRKFEPMAKEKDPKALEIFDQINNLYRVERKVNKQIKRDKLNQKDGYALRLERRQAYSVPIMKGIWEWVDNQAITLVKGTAIYKAIGYIQKLRDDLQVYLSSGSLPMDNNAAENAIRSMVIGRKNYLFVGSEDAGRWAATAYSLTESCRLVCIDFRDYLKYTTAALHDGRTDYQNLTPYALRKNIKRDPGVE